jgi:cell wall-associated NlpC family hydrolase
MRPRRRFPVLAVAVGVVSALWPPAAGTAAPAPRSLDSARAEAALVEAQLEELGRRASELDERYNQARVAAEHADKALRQAEAALDDADDGLARARARLASHATRVYMYGGAAPALNQLIRTRGPDFAVRGRYVETALGAADRALDEVAAARRALADRTDVLEEARDATRDAAIRLAADRDAAAAAVAIEEAALARVRREVSRLLEAREAELAAEAEQQARDAAAAAAAVARRASSPSRPAPKVPVHPPVMTPAPGGPGAAAVAEAARQVGKPYEWAGAGPDTFDCSGLTQWAWRAAGVRLTHSAEYQFRQTRRVNLDALAPGDLLFFGEPIHHVGIYAGNDTMIEAPHTGALVRYRSIWRSDLVGAGRP